MIRKVLIFSLGLVLLASLQSPGSCQTAKQHYYRAARAYVTGDLETALKQTQAALEIDPAFRPAWELRQNIFREKKVLSMILEEEQARQLKKNLAAGIKQYNEGAYSQAVESFRQVLVLDPNNLDALAYLKNIQNLAREDERTRQRNLVWLTVAYGVAYTALAALIALLLIGGKRLLESKLKPTVRPPAPKAQQLFCPKCEIPLPLKEEFCPNCGTRVGLKVWQSVSAEQKRWYDRAGWARNPFSLDIHPEFFTGYKTEVREILEKLSARSGQILVVGPLGAGKTTLLRWLATYLPKDVAPVYISRPPQHFDQLIKHIISSLGFSEQDVSGFDIYSLDQLRKKIGKGLVLLLDEAHEFTIEIERPLRTLGDLDGVNILMAGLPETVDKLKNEIQPLYDRLVLSITLDHLEAEELNELLKARIEGAGGQGTHPFTAPALNRIYELSRGNPRIALKMADAAVAAAINQGEDKVGEQLIKEPAI